MFIDKELAKSLLVPPFAALNSFSKEHNVSVQSMIDRDGNTLAHLAVQIAFEDGFGWTKNSFGKEAKEKNVKTFLEVLRHLDTYGLLDVQNNAGNPPLHHVVACFVDEEKGHSHKRHLWDRLEIVRVIVDGLAVCGVDINMQNKFSNPQRNSRKETVFNMIEDLFPEGRMRDDLSSAFHSGARKISQSQPPDIGRMIDAVLQRQHEKQEAKPSFLQRIGLKL